MGLLTNISLFSGAGGLDLSARWTGRIKTVCYVETEQYPVSVLKSRIREGHLDDAPIWDDVRTFNGRPWRGLVDIIHGGFPCQDISNAGKGAGIKDGTRSGLWFQFLRIINEVRPTFVFVENVAALRRRGLDIVLGNLSEAGYDARWTDLRASDVGAPHRRERIFIFAYNEKIRTKDMANTCKGVSDVKGAEIIDRSNMADTKVAHDKHKGLSTRSRGDDRDISEESGERGTNREGSRNDDGLQPETKQNEEMADSDSEGRQGFKQEAERTGKSEGASGLRSGDDWRQDPADLDPSSESYVGRVAYGVAHRVDRIKCLGNGVVPEQAKRAWEILTGCK